MHAISTAMQNANRRVKKWEAALDSFVGDRVEVPELEAAFPGVCEDGGTFRAHLALATLATSLKRRVVILQGVEAGQSDPDNPFENFVATSKTTSNESSTWKHALTTCFYDCRLWSCGRPNG